jgi:hypothetical protein
MKDIGELTQLRRGDRIKTVVGVSAMQSYRKILPVVLASLCLAALPLVAGQAQDASSPQDIPQNQKLTKEQKQKMKKTLKELEGPFKTWLNEDVVYIISP